MGKASRKKNRWRGQAGGLYSQPAYDKDLELNINRFLHDLKKNKQVNFGGDIIKNESVIFRKLGEISKAKGKEKSEILHQIRCLIQNVYKTYDNFFITSEELKSFIFNNEIKRSDLNKIKTIIENNTKESPIKVEYLKGIKDIRRHGAIHLLNEKYSIIFSLDTPFKDPFEDEKITTLLSSRFKDWDTVLLSSEDWLNRKTTTHKINSLSKAVLNTFLYIDAFPDSIKTGPPPIIKRGGKVSSSNIIINTSVEIKDLYKNGATPHMRRGHFRFLQSDRYKNKRFQTVFVKPTMVRGRASTITSPHS